MNKPQLYIAIHATGMPFNGSTIPMGKSLGGSESAAYYMARELARLGHKVIVFTNHKESGYWDGVQYTYHGEMSAQFPMGQIFHYQMQTPYDVLICQRHPSAFGAAFAYNTKLNLWWLHDLALVRNIGYVRNQLPYIDQVLTVSEFHKNQVAETYGIEKSHITATTNGIDYDLYKGLEDYERQPRSLVFAARPERGLEELVGHGGIMERLPDCHLYVCGYDNTTPQMSDYYNFLWQRCEELPNVTNLKSLGKKQLAELIRKSMLYIYPTNFEDTSCIMAIDANAGGTPFIGCNHAALPETIGKDGSILLNLDENGNVDRQKFVNTINSVLGNPDQWNALHKKALNKRQDWTQAAEQCENLFYSLFEKKTDNKYRLHKHLERQSDIVAAVKDGADKTLPSLKQNYEFYFTGNYEKHYSDYYQHEKEKGVNYGPEDLMDPGNCNFKRFNCTLDLLQKLKHETILDYGCAHGHYSVNLALHCPGVKSVHGIDIEKSNIEKAVKWVSDAKISNVTFEAGQYKDVKGKYDIILLGEVLEHVPNPNEVIETLMEHLTENGNIMITVPYGPWESMGWDLPENKGWRAHIHHFERQDLDNMFSNQKGYTQIALPSGMPNMGHFIIYFSPSGEPLGTIDYDRKLKIQSPQETLSVCMITKNEELKIGKTLNAISDIADEIIIGIDNTTTDNTKDICSQFGADVFMIESPIVQGFDAARNKTIERAKMDWILWIDADETLEQVENLAKYLRNNTFGGYAVKQHHFSVDPEGLIKTDLPCRLFRNNRGAKFYGFVHEHPEIGTNKSVGQVHVLPDVSIMHTGYSTESIRRKRFERNFKLMQKEYELHPDRYLTKFLWLRDLGHMNRYSIERFGRPDNACIDRSNEMIDIWRTLIKEDQIRLVIEGLPFYSEAVNLLGNGIDFTVDCNASKFNGGAPLQNQPISGRFVNKKDIDALMGILLKHKISHFEGKYF